MNSAMNILDELTQAVSFAKADMVLSENLAGLNGTLMVERKRKTIDLLMSFKPKLDAAVLAIGREIYPVEKPLSDKTVKWLKRKNQIKRAEYHAGDVIIEGKKVVHGLNESPRSMHNENQF